MITCWLVSKDNCLNDLDAGNQGRGLTENLERTLTLNKNPYHIALIICWYKVEDSLIYVWVLLVSIRRTYYTPYPAPALGGEVRKRLSPTCNLTPGHGAQTGADTGQARRRLKGQ